MSKWHEYRVPGLMAAAVILVGAAVTVVSVAQGEAAGNSNAKSQGTLVLFPYTGAMIAVILTNSTGARLWAIRAAALVVAAFGVALLVRAALGVRELHGSELFYRTLIPLPLALAALAAYLTEPDPPRV